MVTSNAAERQKTNNSFKKNSYQSKSSERSKPNTGTYQKDRPRPYQSSNNYNRGPKEEFKQRNPGYSPRDKDGEFEDKGRISKPRVNPSKEVKQKEPHTDKTAVINRLEKERKAIQRKSDIVGHKTQKSSKPQMKQKRAGNIDWTKEYDNDSYDELDF